MKNLLISSLPLLLVVTNAIDARGLGQKTQKSNKNLEEMVVTAGKLEGSLTSVTVEQARANLAQIPGGIGFVEATDYAGNFTQSLGDTLVFTPGVFADTSAQRENRISIRGSGLNATFERRGINVYRDGVPITRASGITEFQEIDPLSVKYIEVYKGANGVQYGSNALGGAINIVTPTAQNSDAGSSIRLEAGSFDSRRFNITTIGKTDTVDYYGAFTKLDSNGFRAHSEVDSVYGFGNIGIRLSDNIETRFYITALDDQFELAGSTTLQDARQNPKTAIGNTFVPDSLPFLGGPGLFTAIEDDWDRNLKVKRLANRTTFAFDHWQLETGAWLVNRELDHAITRFAGIIVQDEDEFGVSLRAHNEHHNNDGLIWSLGLTANHSDNDAKRFRNQLGQRGLQSSQDQQDAENVSVYGQINTSLNDSLRLVVGGQYLYSVRQNQHIPLSARDTEDDSGKLTFREFSPQIGLLWNTNEHQQWYVNLSQAQEIPGISDLTSAGVLPFDPLDTQNSTTLEIGTRGQYQQWAWDISVYHSKVENEFIDLTTGRITNTTNSESDTIHQGIEAGFDWQPIISSLNKRGIDALWRHVLTVNDFQFDNHPLYGNNTLAGVPEVSYLTEFSISNANWTASLNVRYVDDGPYADYANTVQTNGYTLFSINAAWQVTPFLNLFVSAENIGDKDYISNVSTVGQASNRSAIFTPGQGRATYAGLAFNF